MKLVTLQLTVVGILLGLESSVEASLKTYFLNAIQCSFSRIITPVFKNVNPNLNYLLFTRENPDHPCDLQPTEDALAKCKFDPKRETKVIIFGYMSTFPPNSFMYYAKNKYLIEDDYNVVLHNWTAYTQLPYPNALLIIPLIGYRMSAWIQFLQEQTGADSKDFHLIPHSTGALIAAYAGKSTCHLGKITYLDPAYPYYDDIKILPQPSATDADSVEAIHTNAAYNHVTGGYGDVGPLAMIDFYVNGGTYQPKCPYGAKFLRIQHEKEIVNSTINVMSCNHCAVYNYYLANFDKKCKFVGLICDSYADFKSGKCNPSNSRTCEMDFKAKKIPGLPVHSKCYLDTSAHYPYCLN